MRATVVAAALLVATASSNATPFVALDSSSGVSHAEARFGAMFLSGDDSDGTPANLVGTRLDLHLEHAFASRLGVVATLPLVFVYRLPGDIDTRVHGGPGALHVGGYYRMLLSDQVAAAIRAGLIAPSEYLTKKNDVDEELVGLATQFPFLEERVATGRKAWAHVGSTVHIEDGRLSAQFDLLADIPIASGLEGISGLPWRMHLGAGAQYARGDLAFGAELLLSGYVLADQPVIIGSDLRSEATFGRYVVELVASVHWKRPSYEAVLWLANPLDGYIRVRYHPVGIGVTRPF